MPRNIDHECYAILTDLTLSVQEAGRRVLKMTRRWKPASRYFVFYMGGVFRLHKMDMADLDRWEVDGGFNPPSR
jgi:hypothetical protein